MHILGINKAPASVPKMSLPPHSYSASFSQEVAKVEGMRKDPLVLEGLKHFPILLEFDNT